ncbi:NUDIX domain-containing protein [Micromonospora echinospora]
MEKTYTHPDVLTVGVREGWADPETDPTRIDWAARQAVAVIPFKVVDGRPVNPCETTAVRYGRNGLGRWGEQVAADALLFATDQYDRRWMGMIERGDGSGWGMPGGHVDPGEHPTDAAFRELREETGLVVARSERHATLPARYVPDPRASDEAWMVTVVTRIELGQFRTLPRLVGADDASRAAWIPAGSYDTAARFLANVYNGTVFAAHREVLAEALG